MGAIMGFGILGICSGTLSEKEKESVLLDFMSRNRITNFEELVTAHIGPEQGAQKYYEIIRSGNNPALNAIALSGKQSAIKEWNEKECGLDRDDVDIVFLGCSVFVPNSTLGDQHEYFDLPGSDGERMVSSIEYGISRIETLKAEYEEDNADGEMEEEIERLNEYLEVFRCAQRNNFVVSFSL